MSGPKDVTGHLSGSLTEKKIHRHAVLINGTEPQLPGMVFPTSAGEKRRIGYFDFAQRF